MRTVQLILQESVPSLGEAGDLVSVKPGFARNYLVPLGKAIVASAGKLKEIEHQKRVMSEKVAKQMTDLNATRSALSKVVLEVAAQAGENGRLFGSITPAQIGELLAEKGFAIDRRRIGLSEPIKEVGEHKVNVKLHREVIGEITVKVVSVGAPPPSPPETDDDDDDDDDDDRRNLDDRYGRHDDDDDDDE